MTKSKYLFIAVTLILVGTVITTLFAYDLPKWFPFNDDNALKEWQEKIFKGRVLYVVESNKEQGRLSANSQETSSGLLYNIRFDVNEHPMMSWRWKVAKFPNKIDQNAPQQGWIEKDDYAARVYVIFSSWNFLQTQSLEYIWDENLKEGTILTSPYLKNIKLIVVESGHDNLGQWVLERRNISEDYFKAFGRKPRRKVSAIALMTDADNSMSSAEAFYKDIKVGYGYEE